MVSVTQAMMAVRPFKNAILVDSGSRCCSYLKMVDPVAPEMGKYIANYFSEVLGLKPESIVIAAHCLGAHIAGYVGTAFQTKGLGSVDTIFGELYIQVKLYSFSLKLLILFSLKP